MIPILFEHNALPAKNNGPNNSDSSTIDIGHGIGDLVDAVECGVKCADDHSYELELTYPSTGRLFSELKTNRLIVAKANNRDNNQIFRIYGYEKGVGDLITVKAQHISYDLNDVIFFPYLGTYYPSPYLAKDVHPDYYMPAMLMTDLKNTDYYLTSNNPFTLKSYTGASELNYPHGTHLSINTPVGVRGVFHDVVETFGGICYFDNYTVYYTTYIIPTGAKQNQVIIEYGKDIIDLQQEENISEMVTGIIPFFKGKDRSKDGDSEWHGPDSVVLGDIHYVSGTIDRHKIVPVDVSSKFSKSNSVDDDIWDGVSPQQDWIPLKQCVDKVGEDLIKNGKYGIPEVNLTLDSTQFSGDVRLYDIVTVRFLRLGIDMNARVSSTTYDVLNERIAEIELGTSRERLLSERWDMEYRKYWT